MSSKTDCCASWFRRWAVLAMLTYFKYAPLAVRCPPWNHFARISFLKSTFRFEILRDSSIYLGDILICFQFFSLFQIVKEQNNSQYTIANILWIIVLYSRDYGGAKRDRTADLLRARQALSQLSYSPIMHSLIPVQPLPFFFSERRFFFRQGVESRSLHQ